MQIMPRETSVARREGSVIRILRHPGSLLVRETYFVWIDSDLYRFDQFEDTGIIRHAWRVVNRSRRLSLADRSCLLECVEVQDKGTVPTRLMQDIMRAL